MFEVALIFLLLALTALALGWPLAGLAALLVAVVAMIVGRPPQPAREDL